MPQPLPHDLRRFVLTSVPSVPYLEAMLLLHEDPHAAWDVPALARRLYVPQPHADELLSQLAGAGFVEPAENEGFWRWRPPGEAAALVDSLAVVYSENLVGVTELIHSREATRAQQFADAFRWKKES